MCGTERAWRFRLFEDATAEYLTSKSNAYDPAKDDILLKKSIQLAKDEYDQLIKLAESSGFMNAAVQYVSKSLIDLSFITDLTYRKVGTTKRYISGTTFRAAK